jgi:cytochrome bd-type quinol oxidase subunit 2
MIRKFRWITTGLALYIAGLVVYVFRDQNSDAWTNYYWLLSSYLVIVALGASLVERKTQKEKVGLCFILLSKVLLTAYYIFCLTFEYTKSEIEGTIVFWVALILAGFVSVRTRKYYIHGK